jgi:hypothetical protein
MSAISTGGGEVALYLGRQAALRQIEQAGGVPITVLQLLFEYQRVWAWNGHYDEVISTIKPHCSLFGLRAENDGRTG